MKKVALFVDFDNIYSGLSRVAPRATEVFATDPSTWLRWLEAGMPVDEGPTDNEPRRVLVRRCYLNPRVYQKYRTYFVLSGFDVIDCPPLTQQGKTSADIRMAMDVLDLLGHETRFDEFIVLSGDADFTPVLLRLRAHDRRTVILAVGFAAQAYKAACDVVVTEGTFIEAGLGFVEGHDAGAASFDEDEEVGLDAAPVESDPRAQILGAIADDLYQEVRKGPVVSNDLAAIYRRQAAFRATTDWLGFGSLRAMTEAVVRRRGELAMGPGNPWPVTLRAIPAPRESQPRASAHVAPNGDEGEALRAAILTRVTQMVADSDRPLVLSHAANELKRELGDVLVSSRWLGSGTFANLLRGATGLPFEIDTTRSPGYLRDPSRHAPMSARERQPAGPLEALARRVNQVTGTPMLKPAVYGAVFRAIAEYLSTNEFHLYMASKEVTLLAISHGVELSRASVVFILRGVSYGGIDVGKAPASWSPLDVARSFRDNVKTLCHDRGLALSDEESEALDRWLIARVEEPPPSPPAEESPSPDND